MLRETMYKTSRKNASQAIKCFIIGKLQKLYLFPFKSGTNCFIVDLPYIRPIRYSSIRIHGYCKPSSNKEKFCFMY